MSDRRSFLARILAGGAATVAVAQASENEPLIVVPQAESVKLYSSMPPKMTSDFRIDWGPSDTIYALPPQLNQIGREVRELCHHVNALNAAVFGKVPL